MPYYVYFVTNYNRSFLYTGLTSNLALRIEQYKARVADSFTKKYNADILVYAQEFQDVNEARARERAIKKME
jgi:putative endonuclease